MSENDQKQGGPQGRSSKAHETKNLDESEAKFKATKGSIVGLVPQASPEQQRT